MLCGGTTETREATAEIQALVDQVRADVEEKAGKPFPHYEAISFKSQLVNGTNYFIKLHIGGDEYVHLRIHQALPHAGSTVQYHSHQPDKTKNDDIVYF